MMEYFTASGARPPLGACLGKIDDADLVIAIVAHRYGWIPPDQSQSDSKSITWLECEHAVSREREVIPLLVDPSANWPRERREEFRIMEAIQDGKSSHRRELVKASRHLPLRGLDLESADPTSRQARPELAKVYVSLDTTTSVAVRDQPAPVSKAWWRRFLERIGIADRKEIDLPTQFARSVKAGKRRARSGRSKRLRRTARSASWAVRARANPRSLRTSRSASRSTS